MRMSSAGESAILVPRGTSGKTLSTAPICRSPSLTGVPFWRIRRTPLAPRRSSRARCSLSWNGPSPNSSGTGSRASEPPPTSRLLRSSVRRGSPESWMPCCSARAVAAVSSGAESNGWRSWTASSSTMSSLAHTTAPAPMPPRAIIMSVPSIGRVVDVALLDAELERQQPVADEEADDAAADSRNSAATLRSDARAAADVDASLPRAAISAAPGGGRGELLLAPPLALQPRTAVGVLEVALVPASRCRRRGPACRGCAAGRGSSPRRRRRSGRRAAVDVGCWPPVSSGRGCAECSCAVPIQRVMTTRPLMPTSQMAMPSAPGRSGRGRCRRAGRPRPGRRRTG